MEGIVKWYNEAKGYGFIAPSDGGKDVFVHVSAINKAALSQLNTGDRVSFDIETRKGDKTAAINLKMLD